MTGTASAIEAATAEHAVAAFSNCTATLNGIAITGIFDNGNAAALGVMLGANPTFICMASDAGSDARSKTLVVNDVSYTVREAKPDGTGITLLELEAG